MNAHIKRREFITLLGGAAAAWPMAARAQPAAKLPTIGVVGPTTASVAGKWTAALVQRLRELVRLKVDVIVTAGTANVVAAKRLTSQIPIVFAGAGDPVGMGLVTSLARPRGNVTGLSNQSTDLAPKRVELLREVVPGLRRLAIMARLVSKVADGSSSGRKTSLALSSCSKDGRRHSISRATSSSTPTGSRSIGWR